MSQLDEPLKRSQTHNVTMFLKSREVFEWPQFPKFRLLRRQNFLKDFLPLVPLGSACGLGPQGRGSRGDTPLHYAANYGHVSAVERLLEAKAAVDAKNEDGRGLGRGFAGENVLRQWDCCEEMDEMLNWFIVQGFGRFLFLLLMESGSQDMCTDILCFPLRPCCLHPLFADKPFSIYDFDLAVFWSDHCNPDILTFTSPIVWLTSSCRQI